MANVLMKMAGNRKATMRYCPDCEKFHATHRAADGAEVCPTQLNREKSD